MEPFAKICVNGGRTVFDGGKYVALIFAENSGAPTTFPASDHRLIVPLAIGPLNVKVLSNGNEMESSHPEADTVNLSPMNSGLLLIGPTALYNPPFDVS